MEGADAHLLAHGRTNLLDQGAIAPTFRQLLTESEASCDNAAVTFDSSRAKMRSPRMPRDRSDESMRAHVTNVIELARRIGRRR
jgi:hypothetical protein